MTAIAAPAPDPGRGSRTDAQVRAALLLAFKLVGPHVCCGGRGLVVGCPRCGRRWPA